MFGCIVGNYLNITKIHLYSISQAFFFYETIKITKIFIILFYYNKILLLL